MPHVAHLIHNLMLLSKKFLSPVQLEENSGHRGLKTNRHRFIPSAFKECEKNGRFENYCHLRVSDEKASIA